MNETLTKILNIAEKSKNEINKLNCFDLQTLKFKDCSELQSELQKLRITAKIPNIILFVEHPPVYTITKHTKIKNILVSRNLLREQNVDFEPVDRGGDVTFHGFGQIVCYPIIDLRDFSFTVKSYVAFLQNLIINALKNIHINCYLDSQAPGVWVNQKKIAALGIRISKFITKHGFALNNNVNLDYFKNIIPCGLKGKNVTSIKNETNKIYTREEIIDLLITSATKLLNVKLKLIK